MKNLVATLMLCVSTIGSASAEWKLVDANDKHLTWVDYETIRKNGQYRDVWVMYDYKNAEDFNGKQFLSIKIKEKVDCNGDRFGAMSFVSYSGNMGAGEVVSTSTVKNFEWVFVVPGSVGESSFNAVCRK